MALDRRINGRLSFPGLDQTCNVHRPHVVDLTGIVSWRG